jgi:hypothetical protein
MSDIELVLHREHDTGKAWFHVGLVLPNGEPFHADIRELFEAIDVTMTVDDLTLLSGDDV